MSDFYNKYPYTDFHELNLDWVIERVKQLTEDWLATQEEWNNTEEQWQQLYDYVHDYFDNLNVQTEINNKINDMIADGTFQQIATPIIQAKVASDLPGVVSDQIGGTVASQIGATVASQIGDTVASQIDAAVVNPVNTWLTQHITQPTTPVVDTSLSISGAAADAAVTGNRILTDDDYISNSIDLLMNRYGILTYNIRRNGYYMPNGNFNSQNGYETGYIKINVTAGDKFLYKGNGTGSSVSVIFYDNTDSIISYLQYGISKYHYITIPSGCVKALFASLRNTSTTPKLTFELRKCNTIIGDLENTSNELGIIPYHIETGYYFPTGTRNTDSNYECGVVILDVVAGQKFIYKGNGASAAVSVIFYDSDDNILSTLGYSPSDYHIITIPSDCVKALFTSLRNVNTTPHLIFELYRDGGGMYNVVNSINSIDVSFMFTLNTVNRLYAANTMNDNKTIGTLDRAVVCIGFDDYNLDCSTAINYLNSLNLPSYLALIPEAVNDDWAMAKSCYDNGGEICAHSSRVLTSTNQNFKIMNDKFITIPTIIGAHGFPVYGIIRAGGTNQGTEDKYMDEYFCRAAGLKYSDYYGVSNQYTLGRQNMTRKTLTEWQDYLDDLEANKGYCIMFCHHVNGTEYNSYPNGFNMTDFQNIISEILSRDIDVMTPNGFVDKYIYNIHPSDNYVR